MRRLTLQLRYTAQATQPQGTPPSFDVSSGQGNITVLESSDTDLAVPTTASYSTTVFPLEDGTFDETGTYFLDNHKMRVTCVVPGQIQPVGEDGVQWGGVTWRLEGIGDYAGAAGVLTSNIQFDQRNDVADDCQILRLLIP